ncbi:hypothetical protein F4814DRAFT_403781 [Daldinia grandis]|nr:hypothetical protein F4814DRAFT_403781 [Daldinia grandis]
MASLVTDFLVNPVIRQARRFSRSSGNHTTSDSVSPVETPSEHKECQDDVISETEEDSYLDDEADESIPSSPSSRSSVHPNPHNEITDLDENVAQFNAINRTVARSPDTHLRNHDIQNIDTHRSSIPISSSSSTMAADGLLSSADLPSPGIERRKSLPEDDGMSSLRKRVFAIQAQDVEPVEKARLMHQLLIEGYTKSRKVVLTERPITPSSPTTSEQRRSQGPLESFKFWQNTSDETVTLEGFDLSPEDLRPTFAPPREISEESGEYAEDPEDDRPLGCEHYRRNVKLQCSTCNRWYTCRFCHDKVEDHNLIRKDTRNMLCMYCGTAQRASDVCMSCGISAARYYCNICKLWNDDPDKPVYHCNDCGICRIGRGIGKDFFHCKVRWLVLS